MLRIIEAVLEGATPSELEACPLPDEYPATVLREEDLGVWDEDDTERDVRRTIRIEEVPLPELAVGEVVVAVMASAINYNTIWSARHLPVPTFAFLQRYRNGPPEDRRHIQPYQVIGSDAAGVVVRTGPGVHRWKVGDRVVVNPAIVDETDPVSQRDGLLVADMRAWGYETNFGGLAHLTVVKATQLMPKPAHLTWEEAACCSLCLGTSYRMLVSDNAVRMKQGDIVLIWGASGGLGTFAVQLVQNGGGIAIGVAGSDRRLEVLRRVGCDVVLDRRDFQPPHGAGLHDIQGQRAFGAAIRDALGEDPHIVFDFVGEATFAASVYVVRRGGAVVTCGSSTGYSHVYDNRHLWMKVKRIVGSHGANAAEAEEANRLLRLGKIVPPLSTVYPFDDVAEAARHVQDNDHVGKVGVLCGAPKEGLGVDDPALRERIGEQRLTQYRV